MDRLAWYILTSGVCLGILLLPYRLWLSKLTHFQWNRVYLLAALALSLILPAAGLQMDTWTLLPIQDQNTTMTPLVTLPFSAEAGVIQIDEFQKMPQPLPQAPTSVLSESAEHETVHFWPVWLSTHWKSFLWSVYFLGLGIGLLSTIRGIYQVIRLRSVSFSSDQPGYKLLFPNQLKNSFSFFHWLFLSPDDRDSEDRSIVEAHEAVHIRQWHSLDVLLAELACKVWWFLPWSRFLRTALRETHEFLADAGATQNFSKAQYSRLVLARTQIQVSAQPVHFFAQSKITKRIIMLNKKPSTGVSRYKYLGIIPILLIAFSLVACIPAPENPQTVEEIMEASPVLQFAGEPFPEGEKYTQGLAAHVNRLKEKPEYCQKLYLRSQRFKGETGSQLEKDGVPSDFLFLAAAESAFDRHAISSSGAGGIWQFMPATAKSCGLTVNDTQDDRKDLGASTQGAIDLLKEQYSNFGSWTAAALAYNRGPKALEGVNPDNSQEGWYELDHERGYLYRILAIQQLMADPGAFGVETGPAFVHPLPREVNAEVTSEFGPRKSPFTQELKNHTGVDFKAPAGTKVYAIADGKVTLAEISDQKVGNHIEIGHSSPLSSRYHHLDEVLVEAGEQITKGQVIGTVGTTGLSTGPHLHLEILEGETPVDPGMYLRW